MSENIEQPSDDIAKLLGRAGELKAQLEENKLDREGLAEVRDQYTKIREDISDLQATENERVASEERKAMLADIETIKDALGKLRAPSKADMIGGNRIAPMTGENNFFSALAMARSRDAEIQSAGKAILADMGSVWQSPDPAAKATVGDTDAAGGYLVPNNVVTAINLAAAPSRSVVDLFTQINGVRGSAVDIPWQDSADARATIVLAGVTKDNANFIVGNYTATLYTLARIKDVGNQLLRQSEGAAEALVRHDLGNAMGLGEDYYALNGTGTSQPYGLLTALGTSGTYVTTFSSPSQSTIAGNWATGMATAAGAVAQRGARPDSAVLNSGDYWTLITSGADAAGFYVDPAGGGYNFTPDGVGETNSGPWGIRVRHSPNMPSDSLVIGDFKSTMFFRGQGYRVDVSSEAGDRWDKNLTGFRAEEEIAFDARPTVYTGRFQRITNIKA